MSRTESPGGIIVQGRRRANGWPVFPMRIFLAAVFLFAGYAKLSYPGFFDPNSVNGLKASVDAVKHGTPIGGALGPLSSHPSLFGHITAYAELAIGLGLLVGLLTRLAALGGMVLVGLIALSINWSGIKEYTGSSGWFTSVDLAVAAALSVYLIGGADPFSLDALIWRWRLKRRGVEEDEPGFRDNELEDSRRRLQGEPGTDLGFPPPAPAYPAPDHPAEYRGADDPTEQHPVDQRTQQLPSVQPGRVADPDLELDPEPESLWNAGRRQPPAGEER